MFDGGGDDLAVAGIAIFPVEIGGAQCDVGGGGQDFDSLDGGVQPRGRRLACLDRAVIQQAGEFSERYI